MNTDATFFEKEGYKVKFDSTRSFRFAILSPEGGWVKTFDTFEQAEQWITNELRAAAKKDRRELAIPAITSTGEEVVIVGVNVNTGKLRLASDPNFDGWLYPNTPTIKKLVVQLHHAQEAAQVLNHHLEGCGYHRYSSGRLESANYEHYITAVEKAFAEMDKAVAKLEAKRAA